MSSDIMLVMWIIHVNNCTVVTLNSTTKMLKIYEILDNRKIPILTVLQSVQAGYAEYTYIF